MKNPLFALLAAGLLLAGTAGCHGSKSAGSAAQHVMLNQEFSLANGATAVLHDDMAFSIHFDRVDNDSRCPIGVNCFTAGKADVVLTLMKGNDKKTVTLTVGDLRNGAVNSATFQGHTVKINGLDPVPKDKVKTEAKDYRVKLVVTK